MAMFAVQIIKGGTIYPYLSVTLNTWVEKNTVKAAYTWAKGEAEDIFGSTVTEATPLTIVITEDKPA